jgi:S-phase kinase-associated protein 1
MLEDLAAESSGELLLPIANVDNATLTKVLEYCEYHEAHPTTPLPDHEDYRTNNILDWDKKFIDVDMKLLFDVVKAGI